MIIRSHPSNVSILEMDYLFKNDIARKYLWYDGESKGIYCNRILFKAVVSSLIIILNTAKASIRLFRGQYPFKYRIIIVVGPKIIFYLRSF